MFLKIAITLSLLSSSLSFAQGIALSAGVIENPDGSFTITKPKMLRGNKELPIYVSGRGACALFGFNRYLRDSSIDANSAVSKSVKLNKDGSYKEMKINGKPYKEVSCYEDGNLRNVGTAGGVIYYHGGDFQNGYFQNKGMQTIQLY